MNAVSFQLFDAKGAELTKAFLSFIYLFVWFRLETGTKDKRPTGPVAALSS